MAARTTLRLHARAPTSRPSQDSPSPPARTDTLKAPSSTVYAACSGDHAATYGIALDHHLYNNMNDCWVRRASKPQPHISLNVSIHPQDHEALGYKPVTATPKSIQLSAMADTGCQSCLVSLSIVRRLGLSEADLIPVTTRMRAANNSGISILGAVILRLTGTTTPGQHLETRQIAYVTNESDRLFISRETCQDLGIISERFPTIGETHSPQHNHTATTSVGSADDTIPQPKLQACDCPRRQAPPPKPTALPFPATETNRNHFCHHSTARALLSLQPHDTVPAQRPTIPPSGTSIPIPMHLCRLFSVQRHQLPTRRGQILQLAHC